MTHTMLMNHVIRRNKGTWITDTGVNILTCKNTIRMDTEETMVINNSFPRSILTKVTMHHSLCTFNKTIRTVEDMVVRHPPSQAIRTSQSR
ncbi:hypothetical protein HanRHA438_Chr09g0417471 [Helianthus annuus]|nr:hypothetical protein HanRHA438_Chr09g0417471 [Helianthus annuus]